MFGRIESDKLTALSTFGLAIATVLLAGWIGQQTSIFQEDFDMNNRPWIGGDQITVFEDYVQYDIQNFGKIPNNLGETKFYAVVIHNKQTPVLRDNLPLDLFKNNPLTVVMPNQKMSLMFSKEIMKGIDEVKNAEKMKDADKILYLIIIMNYPYGNNNHGEYGYIGKYDPETNRFTMTDSWAS